MEFIYLLQTALLNYGPLICEGVHQQVKSISSKHQTASHSRQNSQDGSGSSTKLSREEHKDRHLTQTRETCSRETQTDNRNDIPSPSQPVPSPHPNHHHQSPRRETTTTNNLTKQPQPPNHQPNTTNPSPEPDAATLALRATIRSMRIAPSQQSSTLPFSSIAGLTHVKSTIEEIAHLLLYFPHLTKPLRNHTTSSTTGILLFGPQGTGKTLLVRSFAAKYNLALYDVRASAIMSKFVGDSEKFIRALFDEVCADAPSVLLLDECEGLLCDPGKDAMAGHHYRLLQNELKNCWSDLMYSGKEVIVVGVTNKPGDIDMDGFGRRLSVKLAVGLPSGEECGRIVEARLRELRHVVREEDVVVLGEMCGEKGLTGYDVDCVVEGVLRRGVSSIMAAGRFRRVGGGVDGRQVWVPCEDGKDGGGEGGEELYKKGSWRDVAADGSEITYPSITFEDLEDAINRAVPTVDQFMLRKHEEFAKVYATRVE